MIPAVSIIIPTFRRPDRAVEAARSALAQICGVSFEVLLVDDDPSGSALAPLRALTDPRIVVIHEPRAGVANARNAGLRAARGELIAFLDDDEVAPETWLSELLRVQQAFTADAVFGPVRTRLFAPPRDHAAYFDAFFARDPGHAEGRISLYYGCGCSLIRRASLPQSNPSLPPATKSAARTTSCSRRWKPPALLVAAPKAWVWEHPNRHASRFPDTLRRAFAYGQGPATKAWTGPQRDLRAIAYWMAVGLAQTIIYGAIAFASFLGKTPGRALPIASSSRVSASCCGSR